jgi:hypothetical protein
MLADARLNCLAVAVTDNLTANYLIDESIVANASAPETLPADNTIGSCDLMEKHLIDDVAYAFTVTNTTDTAVKIYRVDNVDGDIIDDFLYETLAEGETNTADYWYGLRRVVITDDNDQCLGIAILNQKDALNEFIVTDEHIDSDGDGVADAQDAFPLDSNETLDTDGDGVGNNTDAFPDDATETTDSDGDGVGNNTDAFPEDATETTDTDGDGVGNNTDAFPEDATETTDTDSDGVGNNTDAFPEDASETLDTDGDEVGDNSDAYPNDANKQVVEVTPNKKGGSSQGIFLFILLLAFIRFKSERKQG